MKVSKHERSVCAIFVALNNVLSKNFKHQNCNFLQLFSNTKYVPINIDLYMKQLNRIVTKNCIMLPCLNKKRAYFGKNLLKIGECKKDMRFD